MRGDESGAGAGTMRLFPATVVFLDDSSHRFTLDKKAKGQDLLTAVFQHLELTEREYFGLVWSEGGAALPPGHAPDVTRWLDPAKPVRKQMRVKGVAAITLYFRLKFYVTDPSRLQEEYTRYHAYLQVKHDLTVGRLVAPVSTVCLLTSYAVQSSLGDWDPDTSRPPYLGKTTNTSSYSD